MALRYLYGTGIRPWHSVDHQAKGDVMSSYTIQVGFDWESHPNTQGKRPLVFCCLDGSGAEYSPSDDGFGGAGYQMYKGDELVWEIFDVTGPGDGVERFLSNLSVPFTRKANHTRDSPFGEKDFKHPKGQPKTGDKVPSAYLGNAQYPSCPFWAPPTDEPFTVAEDGIFTFDMSFAVSLGPSEKPRIFSFDPEVIVGAGGSGG